MGDRLTKPDQPGQADEPTEASGGGAAQPHDSMFRFVFGEPKLHDHRCRDHAVVGGREIPTPQIMADRGSAGRPPAVDVEL
jgi:hypothetical protein